MGVVEDALGRFFSEAFATEYIVDKKINLNLVFTRKEFNLQITRFNLLSFSISIIPISYYVCTKNWLCNNLFGIAFSIEGIANFTILPNFMVKLIAHLPPLFRLVSSCSGASSSTTSSGSSAPT